jgi:hypothetical protein
MSVLKTLRESVAAELNHLYTTPPAETPDGLDCGWHGREHALHAFFVARMFGSSADLRSGDYAILSPYLPPLTSVGKNLSHAWCAINGVAPVDLSLTFQLLGQAPQLQAPIVGEGRNGDWQVHYAEDEAVLDEGFGHSNEIIFIERDVHAHSEAELLENPFVFLTAPKPDDPKHWSIVHGPGLAAKITLHCHALATRAAKSIRQKHSREEALAWIAGNYPDAETKIAKLIQS